MKQIKTIKSRGRLAPFWVVVGIFLVTTVAFTIETATSGAELAELTRQEQELLEVNRKLSASLLKVSSLTTLGERAENLGFLKPVTIIYLLEPKEVAKVLQP
ncbi:hypothetical protein A2V56_03595 [Candidatus Woesebacteria bacterium RBG_19FT_COMBO_42_9]|uniref:Cell division protein FtsL n=1 Tax=Candidatus Woesebacteria bacterium RBG_16_42_24 TaxID=1802485 RepID=A0A1F7XME2_9BACT|nr:MAG: hypothetical protein A2V97_00645 [Candidatus Woesebacteria bacterium RBG_16_42_24]OGM16137.1 MAG: hypothetical protein A2V56_03595 [Candidatus Woesebacteria bacterium RBG_19FT_COMBO_42_9]OGM67841.1 MAG: hypothetical protein A2985_00200 [Candidatus Woesebacteria bacterium RIFCSPLOWO2_01_FULL_43_11]